MDFSMLFERFELCDDGTITMKRLLKALGNQQDKQ
jgi:hypothetical protein